MTDEKPKIESTATPPNGDYFQFTTMDGLNGIIPTADNPTGELTVTPSKVTIKPNAANTPEQGSSFTGNFFSC
jgi:hypothetical protein